MSRVPTSPTDNLAYWDRLLSRALPLWRHVGVLFLLSASQRSCPRPHQPLEAPGARRGTHRHARTHHYQWSKRGATSSGPVLLSAANRVQRTIQSLRATTRPLRFFRLHGDRLPARLVSHFCTGVPALRRVFAPCILIATVAAVILCRYHRSISCLRLSGGSALRGLGSTPARDRL